jgi:ribonuclease P protein component
VVHVSAGWSCHTPGKRTRPAAAGRTRNVAPASLCDKGLRGFPQTALRIARATTGAVHLAVSASRAVPDLGPRAAASRRLFVEAHVPTEQSQARQDPRVSTPHADQGRACCAAVASCPRSQAPLGLIWRVRDRATFEALAGARRQRAGPVSLRHLSDGSDDPPRVAYAIGRRFGNAVERNRARRRLRAAVALESGELRPGGVYLFAADRSVMTLPFPTLRAHVTTLLRAVGEEPR